MGKQGVINYFREASVYGSQENWTPKQKWLEYLDPLWNSLSPITKFIETLFDIFGLGNQNKGVQFFHDSIQHWYFHTRLFILAFMNNT